MKKASLDWGGGGDGLNPLHLLPRSRSRSCSEYNEYMYKHEAGHGRWIQGGSGGLVSLIKLLQ